MADTELVRQLNVLAELHAAGVITEEEFNRAKTRVLASPAGEAGNAEGGDPPAASPTSTPHADPITSRPAPDVRPRATTQRMTPPGRGATQAPRPQHPTAYVIAGGGLLTLLAFFAMPLISVPILGSATGAGVAQLSSEIGSLALLWLVPLAGIAVTGVGARHGLVADVPAEQRRVGSIIVMVAAALVVLIYLVALIALASEVSQSPMARAGVSATSFTGAGFWIAMIAMIAAGGAALVDLRTAEAGQ